eukprot:603332-Alexandrium_andersonii.AAC.1
MAVRSRKAASGAKPLSRAVAAARGSVAPVAPPKRAPVASAVVGWAPGGAGSGCSEGGAAAKPSSAVAAAARPRPPRQ